MRPRLSRPLNKKVFVCALIGLVILFVPTLVFGADGGAVEHVSFAFGTFWSLVPPIVAIALALITKEVYISLFVGIFVGGMLYANGNPITAIISVTDMFTTRIADYWNAGILIFLVVLGIMVSLMNKAGGSRAYGEWAAKRIKTRKGSMLATIALGIIIFVDDYFNCLTVGSVMRPVTDKFKVSRAKLSYIIDATAAPVCIIAPISSWAAAVTGSVSGDVDGFKIFLEAIPFNYYALMTILFMIALTLMNFDYGPMKRAEKITQETGDLHSGRPDEYENQTPEVGNPKGKVIDLVLPVIVLIVLCIVGMVYTGGFFDSADPDNYMNFISAFSNSDAAIGLSLGSIVSLIFAFVYFMCRRVMKFKDFAASLPDGFRQMVPAILILVFAWTLAGFCNESLGASTFVENALTGSNFFGFMPAIIFLIGCGVSFATGTSWGTFGILIPIAQAVFPGGTMLTITIAAAMAGAVFGDHCSPISDTTIMASAGARVNHILHVSTQMPYAITVGIISFVLFLLAGFVNLWYVVLPIGIVITLGTLFVIRFLTKRKDQSIKPQVTPKKE